MSLAGKTVVVTRAAHQAGELVRLLEARGARAVRFPTIDVAPTKGEDAAAADRAVRDLAAGGFAGLLFTSVNAVAYTRRRVEQLGMHGLPHVPCFAIGDKTAAALTAWNVAAVVVDGASVGAGLVAAVRARFGEQLRGRRFLLPRAKEGREEVVEGLHAAGAEVVVVAVYETRPIAGPPLAEPADWLTFTSPSAVAGFLQRGPWPPGSRIAVIGPTTAEAVRAHGRVADVVAPRQTIESMLEAMAQGVSR